MAENEKIVFGVLAIMLALALLLLYLKYFGDRDLEEDMRFRISESDYNNFERAMSTGNIDYCYEISNEALWQECVADLSLGRYENGVQVSPEDLDSFEKAIMEADPGHCQNIIDEALRNECIEIISTEQADEPPLHIESEDYDYFEIAIMENNRDRCNQIQNSDLRQECLYITS